ncbi:polysaccharide biosynthesis/export family protein (plasmid) [Salipiger sp. H15]|uniref:Polysaccharide biosynthesis/export family protein n=1 Tax=Alloyangia sp. H15 TaxID=3029062 RepID=A0AAU8APR4_9RHOB
MKLSLPPLLAAAAIALAAAAPLQAEEYRLGIGDTINVEMVMLENGKFDGAEVLRLEAEGERIGPDGRATVSFIGAVQAADRTVDELASDITRLMSAEIPVSIQPFVTVSVSAYRPISILGAVMTPGTYDYQPGMSLRDALARAGGTGATYLSDIPPVRIIEAMADRSEAEAELKRLMLTRQRLQAEIDQSQAYQPEPEDGFSASDIARETEIFRLRKQNHETEAAYLQAEVERSTANRDLLQQNLDVLGRQLADSEREAARRAELGERGLAVADTLFQMNNHVNDLEIRRIQSHEDMRDAEQDIARARNALASNETNRSITLQDELKSTEAKIGNLRIRIAQDDLLTNGSGGQPGADQGKEDRYGYKVISQRLGGDERDATRDTVLSPGDVVEVTALPANPVSQ